MIVVQSAEKLRGAFFTPRPLSDFVVRWAIRGATDTALEPSCGEAAFLLSAVARLRELGGEVGGQLQGFEIDEASAARARALLQAVDASASIVTGDFFDQPTAPIVDAVIGNPPFIRYQSFAGVARAKAQRAALAQGVTLAGLASSWAAFVVHASAFLRPEGRLGLVLPAELLHVNYAAAVRQFLMKRFARVSLVTFERLVFPDVSSEVVLLLAEGEGPTDVIHVRQLRGIDELEDRRSIVREWRPDDPSDKWTAALAPPGALDLQDDLLVSGDFVPLGEWGRPFLGSVTGRNKYFALTRSEAAALQLHDDELLPIAPPGSKHLRGLTYTQSAHNELLRGDGRVLLFYPPRTLSAAAAEYIETGEQLRVDSAYKCRVRNPWWKVPLAPVPDLFLTYMNHDSPRLISNSARVRFLNSVHGVTLTTERRLGKSLLPIASLNTASALGGELVGRSYGGGLLKVEPREASNLPVPSPELVSRCAEELRELRPLLGRLLRAGQVDDARQRVDEVLLLKGTGRSRRELHAVRDARDSLRARRFARAASTP